MKFYERTLELRAAYGRNYNTQKSFKKDFNEERYFLSSLGYCSKKDINVMIKEGYETIYYNFGNKILYIVRFGKISNWVKK